MWTVDIDVGGTLTDGLFTNGGSLFCVKVDTTPHDLTVCLLDCLTQAGTKLDFPDLPAFLEDVELIRWSTTITSNVLAERRGPRVGLLVSRGHERDLYGSEPQSPILDRLLNAHDVLGLDGNLNEAAVMNAARSLLERGVRRICISLQGAHRGPESELAAKRIIDELYPDHFLGSVPVLCGSEISKSADDRTRTYCAVINAYTHGALAASLFKAEDDLRETLRYHGAFLVSHINGGVAGIAKTKAIETIESGPVLGIGGSAFLAQLYGTEDVIAMDVGGTTAKISVLGNGAPLYHKPSDLFGISFEISLPYLRSIALGGGSVIKVAGDANAPRVELGPESMGSYPGPACYALGGDQPTLTDVFVTSGLIDPEYFLGGTKPIDRELARKVVDELADDGYLLEFALAAREAGASRVRYCDTTGGDAPGRIRERFAKLASAVAIPVETHCHNYLGMAVANSVSGALGDLDAGQDAWVNTCVNGSASGRATRTCCPASWRFRTDSEYPKRCRG